MTDDSYHVDAAYLDARGALYRAYSAAQRSIEHQREALEAIRDAAEAGSEDPSAWLERCGEIAIEALGD